MIEKKSILFVLSILMIISSCKSTKKEEQVRIIQDIQIPTPKIMKFGINFADYDVHEKKIKKGQSLSTLLDSYQIPLTKKETLDSISNYIKPRDLKIRNDYYILTQKGNPKALEYFIYKKDLVEYIIVDLKEGVKIRSYKKPIVIREEMIGGNITGSLSKTLSKNGLGRDVVGELSNIYKWSINFFKLKREDEFAMIYDERFVEDSVSIGMDYLKAVKFKHKGKDFYAFARKDDKGNVEYFNEKGNQLKAMFLKAPLKFFRISSKYNLKRFHPVQKRVKPHLGTDYAAPHGTPILATANGVITRKGYGRGNGNFIKIKHNGTYSTQYLHMSRFRKGLKVGSYVNQGDVIGYVGSTGLATGPHVCYRFWKNNKQVDPLKQNLPNRDPLTKKQKEVFLKEIKPLKVKLDGEIEKVEGKKES
ncbi:putative metalloprotease [Flavobacteriaceae bacterium UJ101]|nr:putative metalloprotease [Flavobacteriaceae bacterium UJ101]